MWILLGTTITASFFDSLNPSAIAQQMMLQAMVKHKRHIWFFILGIGTANFVLGMAIYYGIAAWISRLLSSLTRAYPLYICGAELTAGLVCLAAGICLVIQTRKSCGQGESVGEGGERVRTTAQLAPLPLFLMGAAFCAVELTSALPYFGFLAMMASYDPIAPVVVGLTLVYDFMYMLPLILLYFGYSRLQGTALIVRLERILGKVSAYIVPGAVSLLGGVLAVYGTSNLI